MNAKKSLLLIFIILTCAAIACDISALGQNSGSSQGGNSQPVSGSPRVNPTFPPTYTPTPTLLPTATSTPGEVVPPTAENSPTPTPTPPPEGWMVHGTLGFHIILPERWSVVEEQFAGDTLKFEAIDSKDVGSFNAHVAVSFQYQYGTFTIQEICDYFGPLYESVGMERLETKCGFELNGLPAGRFIYRYDAEGTIVRSYMYFMVENTRIWLVELIVDESAWSSYTSTFQTIAESFVLD